MIFARLSAWILLPLLLLVLMAGTVAHAGRDQAPGHVPGASTSRLAYLVSDLRIPFWQIMARGIRNSAAASGFQVDVYSADNDAKKEMEHTVAVIRSGVDGIIVSPTNSTACTVILKLSRQAGIPVVIADIGTDGGDYVSFIASDNLDGAYRIGKILAERMGELGWQKGTVGIIAIPQKRVNGQLRTAGFMKAMEEAGIKGAGLEQQVDFSYQETYRHARSLIAANPGLRAIWLQGSDRYRGALDAIADAGRKGEILLLTFDAEPEFLDLIPRGVLVGAAMQQPFLIGEEAVRAMGHFLRGLPVEKRIQLPILAVSARNLKEQLPLIKRNVLGMLTD
jgi:ribose transport system substrate-binding protein